MLLYIHIPFCDSKCHYCAFNSYVDKFELKESYMDAICSQLDFELERFDAKKASIESVFIGGGTPSTIHPKLYQKLFKKILPYLKSDIEITSEANPNSATKKWLDGMRELGVNRISFGVQSFDEAKLRFLNRSHDAKIATQAVENAKKIGFDNISIDLIYGTKLDTKELLKNDINIVKTMPINHLSAYALSIEEGTHFWDKNETTKDDDKLSKFLFTQIKSLGFEQYEISNFGTYKSYHNLGYWRYKDYIGLGSGAVGKLKNQRFYPLQEIEAYIKNPLHAKIEMLSKSEQITEKIFLGLRCIVGVNKNLLNNEQIKKAKTLIDEKKLYEINQILYNPNYLISDELALYLM